MLTQRLAQMSLYNVLEACPNPSPNTAPLHNKAIVSEPAESEYPPRPDGRNAGFIPLHHLALRKLLGHLGPLEIRTYKKCCTLATNEVQLIFNEESTLSLAKWVNSPDATDRNLPRSLGMERLLQYLTEALKQLKDPLRIYYGRNFDPLPLAEIKSPIQVDIFIDLNTFTTFLTKFGRRLKPDSSSNS
jgi:hypothetical protein